MNSADFSSQIVFKVRLGQEIKKVVIHNDEINYNELLLMMQRIFSEKIKINDEFTIKYTDEENDLITLTNDSDVTLALQSSKSLKLTLFLKDEETKEEEIKPVEILRELASIRSSIDKFLEKFDKFLKLEINLQKLDESKRSNDLKLPSSISNQAINNELHKEFDPLNKQQAGDNLANRFQAKNSRAQTPDSITSIEFSHSDAHRKMNAAANAVDTSIQQPYVSSSLSKPVDQHHHNQLHVNNGVQADQQAHLLHQQQQYQQQHFNGAAHNLPPNPQQQPQQQLPQQQQQPQQQFYANPTPLKAPVATIPPVVQPPQTLQQHHQHPAVSQSNQSPFLPPTQIPNGQQIGLQQPQGMDPQQQQQYYQQQMYAQQYQQQQPQQQQQQQPQPQQQQPLQHPSVLQSQHQQQLNQQSPSNPSFPPASQFSGSNPYSAKTGGALARPPSATYQPGYK